MYIPPEVLSHRKPFGQAGDMWSIGIILYILVTGTFPFPIEADGDELIDRIV